MVVATCGLLAGCGGSGDGEKKGSEHPRPSGFVRLDLRELPPPIVRDAQTLPRQLGDPAARINAYRGRSSVVGRAVGPVMLPGDPPLVLLTFRGHLTFRRSHHPNGTSANVHGPFAYRIYDPSGKNTIGQGVLKHVPRLGG